MDYDDVVRDFADRTLANLRFLEEQKRCGRENVFEVTQLVNSMLGLLVFPKERMLDNIPKIPLEKMKADGWPVPRILGNFENPKDLRQLIRYLRNAIAHFNLEFQADANREIHGLRVQNRRSGRTGSPTWEAELSVEDLRGIAERFVGLLRKGPATSGSRSRSVCSQRSEPKEPTRRPALPTARHAPQRPVQMILREDLTLNLTGSCLFYPCSGTDLAAPLRAFLPFVASFWFVDSAYRDGDRQREWVLRAMSTEWALDDETQTGRTSVATAPMAPHLPYRDARGCVSQLAFRHRSTPAHCRVRLVGADAVASFEGIDEPLGVFFYRGDGNGEGGSGIPWLSDQPGGLRNAPGQMSSVLSRLVEGGLVVTDGCNLFDETEREPYRALRAAWGTRDVVRAFKDARDFEDGAGRRFACVGYLPAGQYGKGPTLVWQVRKG